MKLPSTIYDSRVAIGNRSGRAASPLAAGAHGVTRPTSGIALIITLILLSVTLVMAVAFLAISRRERNAVTATSDTATARIAADSALAAAQAQIAASILATNTGDYNYSLLVSTNFQNSYGFNPAAGANPTNVNYFYPNGTPLTGNDLDQNIANLWFLPRAPVMTTIDTNDPAGRFYLDLNRNGRFEDTGTNVALLDYLGNTNGYGTEVGDPQWIGVLEHPDQPHGPNNHFIARYAFLAQPIGNSLDLNYIHNQVFNRSQNLIGSIGTSDGYFRNEGVGSWELNLAGFLADLNTNQWDPPLVNYYDYRQPAYPNQGYAFYDAASLLAWRYDNTYNSLAVPLINFYIGIMKSGVDAYTLGNLMTTPVLPVLNNAPSHYDSTSVRWAGSDNTNRFFALPDDLFDPAKSYSSGVNSFTNRLLSAGTKRDSYDRYTYYRLLAQLGTESTADSGKLNLNYSNAVVSYFTNTYGSLILNNVAIVPGAETNLISWRPLDFFTAAADQLLRVYTTNWFRSSPSNYLATYYGIHTNYSYVNAYGSTIVNDPTGWGLTNLPLYGMTNTLPAFGLTNIPVYVNGQFVYRPAVNRILQLAANIYDASTNNAATLGMNYPSVFKPFFTVEQNGTSRDLFISGYNYISTVGGPNDNNYFLQPGDAAAVASVNLGVVSPLVNIYGVPWIIGAKKGFPNFNKFGMQDVIQITRKLQVARKRFPTAGSPLEPSDIAFTNQLYAFSISNSIGVECWNSYTNYYPNQVSINVRDTLSMWITNSYGLPQSSFVNYLLQTNLTVYPWPGYANNSTGSFIVPINRTAVLLTNSDFYFGTSGPQGFVPDYANTGWETTRTTFDLPIFGLQTTNHVQLSMLDYSNNVYHVIDYVQFAGPNSSRDLNAVFQTNSFDQSYDNMWSTYLHAGLPYGVANQLDASLGIIPLIPTFWKNVGGSQNTAQDEIDGFREFFGLNPMYPVSNKGIVQYYTTNYTVQVPYTPTATIYDYVNWQANDPLVHYMVNDLINTAPENGQNLQSGIHKLPDNAATVPRPSYTQLNERYQPWGRNTQLATFPQVGVNAVNSSAYNLTCKDPLVTSSDFWNFPTNRYPTVGWIGRVHRGTPWQTVYLKAHNVLHSGVNAFAGTNTWTIWTGDYNNFDAANSGPLQDRLLFDVFNTSLNDNATHGALSVNQTHLAAWSALFSGMVALTNPIPDILFNNPKTQATNGWLVISPAGGGGTYSALGDLVTNINNSRSVFTNGDGVVGTFEHKGDILSVAALTEQSPFLNRTGAQLTKGISDEVYEWLPQQMLGLLRGSSPAPQFVVYCYGQSLAPAPDGMVTVGGSYFGLVTNYQVTAESAVRAVIRVDPHVTPTGTNYTTTVESYNVLPPD